MWLSHPDLCWNSALSVKINLKRGQFFFVWQSQLAFEKSNIWPGVACRSPSQPSRSALFFSPQLAVCFGQELVDRSFPEITMRSRLFFHNLEKADTFFLRRHVVNVAWGQCEAMGESQGLPVCDWRCFFAKWWKLASPRSDSNWMLQLNENRIMQVWVYSVKCKITDNG